MKICFILSCYPKDMMGGAELQAYLIAKELSKLGHDVYYLAINTTVNRPFYEVDEGISIYRFKMHVNILQRSAIIFKVFYNIKPDIIYCRTKGELPLAYILSKFTNTPLVYGIASDMLCYKAKLRIKSLRIRALQKNNYLVQKLFRRVNVVITQSNHQKELLEKNLSIKSLIIKKGLPTQNVIFSSDHVPIVTWVSNLKPGKRPELFVELAERCKDLRAIFVIAGRVLDAKLKVNTEGRIAQIPNINYLGEVKYDEGDTLIGKSAIFIGTSKYEGFPPTVFIQAWVKGVPTVSLINDSDNTIENNKLGYQCESFEEMVMKVRFLLRNEKIRRTMGENAKIYARKEYNIDKIVKRYEYVFLKLGNNRENTHKRI